MLASVSAALLAPVPLTYAGGSEKLAFTPTVPRAEKAALRIFAVGSGAPPSHVVPLVSTDTVIRLPANELPGANEAGVRNATRAPTATTPSPNQRNQRWSIFFWLLIALAVLECRLVSMALDESESGV